MAFQGKNKNFIESLKHAMDGIVLTIQTESNIKIQAIITMLVILAGFFFQVSQGEWLIIILCIGVVIGMELMNTAIEHVVDLASHMEYHELAKKAKDASAGAVLVVTIMSVSVGMIIFIPKIINLLFN